MIMLNTSKPKFKEKFSTVSDTDIIYIVDSIIHSFTNAANKRHEYISKKTLSKIINIALTIYQRDGKKSFDNFLKYETNIYLECGLRDDFE